MTEQAAARARAAGAAGVRMRAWAAARPAGRTGNYTVRVADSGDSRRAGTLKRCGSAPSRPPHAKSHKVRPTASCAYGAAGIIQLYTCAHMCAARRAAGCMGSTCMQDGRGPLVLPHTLLHRSLRGVLTDSRCVWVLVQPVVCERERRCGRRHLRKAVAS